MGEDPGSVSISLSLTENYAPSWRTWEGVRELVQNWYDGLLSSLDSLPPAAGRPELKIHRERHWSYKATAVSSTGTEAATGGVELGSLVYSEEDKSLALVNRDTSLQRKVLLLGYSKKASHHDIIGQFGEGLKVGALALLRSGQEVSMVTSQDSWRFRLRVDPTFHERVLTIHITDRLKDKRLPADMTPECPVGLQWDTWVQIWPLTLDEWDSMACRFLFLSPAVESVETELGTLLLDSRLQGQLYVRQVWVSDQTKDGLAVGVNFKNLRIDRDRRAVVHQSDIDHQVSSMWVRALEVRPKLASRYFQMLQQSSSCDVRHASYYINEVPTASLIAQEFFRQYGDEAVPVLNSTASETLHILSRELREKVVLCNQSLLEILLKSGRVRNADELLKQKTAQARQRVLLSSLSRDELSAVSHAVELVKIALPDFQSSNIDIYQGHDNTVTCADSQFEVPLWMLRREAVHTKAGCRASHTDSCHCVAAFLCDKILTASQTGKRADSGLACGVHHVVSCLARQACGAAQAFCMTLHSSAGSKELSTCTESGAPLHVLQQREKELQSRIEQLQLELQDRELKYKQDLTELTAKLTCVEQQLTKEEVRLVDMEQHLIDSFKRDAQRKEKQHQAEVEASQTRYDSLYKEFLGKSDKLEHAKKELERTQDLMDDERVRHARHVDTLESQSQWYLKRLADRVDKLCELQSAHSGSPAAGPDSELATLLFSIAREFENDKRKNLCLVCASNTKDCVLMPCRHHHTCTPCARLLPKCPVCRTAVHSVMHVFT